MFRTCILKIIRDSIIEYLLSKMSYPLHKFLTSKIRKYEFCNIKNYSRIHFSSFSSYMFTFCMMLWIRCSKMLYTALVPQKLFWKVSRIIIWDITFSIPECSIRNENSCFGNSEMCVVETFIPKCWIAIKTNKTSIYPTHPLPKLAGTTMHKHHRTKT